MTYYHISQLTGRGYEILLDAVESTMIVWFEDGHMYGIRPNCGTITALGVNPVMDDIIAHADEPTLEAA